MNLSAKGARVRVKRRISLKRGQEIARGFAPRLKRLAKVLVLVGSVKRQRPEVSDIEFVILPANLQRFHDAIIRMGFSTGSKRRKYVGNVEGAPVEIYVARDRMELGSMIQMYTGDYLFNIAMRTRAKKMGYKYNQYGIFTLDDQPVLQSPDERDFFEFLGMEWHEPEQRSVAARQDLEAMIRDLKKRNLSKRDLSFIDKSGKKLRSERYIPVQDELSIRKLHASRKTSMGYRMEGKHDIRRWSPHGPEIPKKSKWIEDVIQHIGEPWREPDVDLEDRLIWYGPAGPEGDVATELELEDDRFVLCEYQHVEGLIENYDPDFPFLKICTDVSFADLVVILQVAWGLYVNLPEDPSIEDLRSVALYAASAARAKQAYYGGHEDWVDSLP